MACACLAGFTFAQGKLFCLLHGGLCFAVQRGQLPGRGPFGFFTLLKSLFRFFQLFFGIVLPGEVLCIRVLKGSAQGAGAAVLKACPVFLKACQDLLLLGYGA